MADMNGFEIMIDAAGNGYHVPRTEVKDWQGRGFRIYVPEPPKPSVVTPVVMEVEEEAVPEPAPVDPNRVDVNSATEKELIALPGVGLAIAKRIVQNRPYSNVQDLMEKVSVKDPGIWVALEDKLSYGPIN